MIPVAILVAAPALMVWLKLRPPGPLRRPAWTLFTYRCHARRCERTFTDRYDRWLHEKSAHQYR